jgi:branched-chain amino acid transport system substrate-binding protein
MMERLGMTMAVEEYKEKGVLGRPVKLVVEDDETDPQVGARKARRLIEVDKVKYLIGGVSSSVAVSVGEVAQRNGALYIASNQNSDTLTEQYGRRVQFMVPPDMAMALRTLAPYLVEKVGKRWYFLTHDYEWGWSGTKWARIVLQKFGGTDLGESKIPMNTRDFSAFLLKVRSAKPDALVLTVGGIDLAALMEQMYEFGIYKETTVVCTLINFEDLWAVGPDKMQGIHLMEWHHYIDAPGVKEFVAAYKKRWPATLIPVPTANTLNGYIGVREMLRGIERAGKDDVTAVIKAMEGHTSPDSLKHDPLTIRDWDHKFLWASYVVRSKKGSEMKDRTDFVEVLRWSPGKDTARTRDENKVNLGPYPS